MVDVGIGGAGIGAGPVVVVVVSRVLVTAGSSPPQAESSPVVAIAANVRHTRSAARLEVMVMSMSVYWGPVEDWVVVVVVLVGGGGGAATVVLVWLSFETPLLSW